VGLIANLVFAIAGPVRFDENGTGSSVSFVRNKIHGPAANPANTTIHPHSLPFR
jgi:hypothetical protein